MQAIARDMVEPTNQTIAERQPVTDEYIQLWVNQLEQWTNIFYNNPTQNPITWQDAQTKLVQFQKIHNPFELCTGIIKTSRNSLVLYQATLCLKNAVANDFKRFDMDELFKLFQFLYEFLCSQALENEMSVNETAALICAMIIKRIASERTRSLSAMAIVASQRQTPPPVDKDADRITHVITTLCNHIKEPNEALSKKIASALMLNSLLLESQMTNRSTILGIRVWKHLNARRLIETHLKMITEVCLETINWAFSSNLLNPTNQTPQTQILFHLVGSLIQCVEYSLSFNSTDTGCSSSGDRLLRVIQSRTINSISAQANELDQRMKTVREWSALVMGPRVVQFLFDLYTTIKSMINCAPGWNWPSNLLKNCLNCLYYLSDVHNSLYVLERDFMYSNFVGNLMLGAVKIMEADVQGIDDSFQIACLITSISMHTTVDFRDSSARVRSEHFVPFLDAAQKFTCKVFTQVASTSRADEEEEEEKTVDALLDFWYHLLRNIEAQIRTQDSANPHFTMDVMRSYSRVVIESYISCHLHKPLGQLVPKNEVESQEVDLEQADEQDDNNIHAQQLVSFGMIARFDALHTTKLLIELLSSRVNAFETMLTQYINVKPTPDGLKEWEYINDDIHWLLLMLQHFLTQTGYGEIGFMCAEILNASITAAADVQKTIQGFEKCDYSSPEVDPIVRLMLIVLKLCQLEMGICQSGKVSWLSVQTNGSLTTLLSRFCLSYLYPKESDYAEISENMNFCFGQDSPTAEKFLRFVIEHTCCMILHMKSDPLVVKKNVQLMIQLLMYHPHVKNVISEGEAYSSMIKEFLAQMRPDNLTGFSPLITKSIIKLATRLFVEEDDWNKLIEFFTSKWTVVMDCIQNQQHQSEMVSNKFLEFCDFSIGVCEACDDETSERLFEQLLVPIVKGLPAVLDAFANFESVPIAVFELLYYIVKLPMVNITSWESPGAKSFYEHCKSLIDAYSRRAVLKKRGNEEEDCEDIISVLTFCHEVMKRDWGNSWASCDGVVKFAMEKISAIIKPEYIQFPRVRGIYYRLLVYLVDEDERLANLSDILLNTIVSSILLALQSQFDKEVDSHTYTIVGIVCRAIYLEKGTPTSERLAEFMVPVLPALFRAAISQGSYTINTETAELIAPAFFSLRCCYMNIYQSLVTDLIEKQDDPFAQSKVKSLFENLEGKIGKLTLNRSACREFNQLFVPFLAELHNYVTVK